MSCYGCRFLFILLNVFFRDVQEIEAAKKILEGKVRAEPSELLETIETAEVIRAVEEEEDLKFAYFFFQCALVLTII